jgi:hypothetical protein
MTWSRDELGKTAEADDLHISPFREKGDVWHAGIVQYDTDVLFRDLWLRPDLAPREKRPIAQVVVIGIEKEGAVKPTRVTCAVDCGVMAIRTRCACRWPRPVRPGDELRVESEVLEVRGSKSRPDQGVIKVRATTLNQHDEAVQIFVGNLIVPGRPSSSPQ